MADELNLHSIQIDTVTWTWRLVYWIAELCVGAIESLTLVKIMQVSANRFFQTEFYTPVYFLRKTLKRKEKRKGKEGRKKKKRKKERKRESWGKSIYQAVSL